MRRREHLIKSSIWSVLAACLFVSIESSAAAQGTPDALDSLSLEQLTQVQVYSASGYFQAPDRAPASVSVITADDISIYGYRTLADILRSVRSLFFTFDRDYSSLGVRGIARPGDYNTRVLLLLDGHRMNDDVYDQATIGTEFPLDVDLIERVEVLRGPVSSLYGSNALLGVINIITKRGSDVNSLEVTASAGSFNTDQLRLTYGKQRGALDLLLTTTLFRSKGHNHLFFPVYDSPTSNDGIASHVDHDEVQSAFASLSRGSITLHGLFGTRDKQIPSAPYGVAFNNPGTCTVDSHTFIDAQDEQSLSSQWKLLSRAFYDVYHYSGRYAYASLLNAAQISPEIDLGYGQWAGAEAKATRTSFTSTGILGLEFRDNFRQNQKTYDLNPFAEVLNDQRTSYVIAPYGQYERSLARRLTLNAGVRYDYYSDIAGSWDPRLALIAQPVTGTTLRVTYGASFRAPNVYERSYAVAPNNANPALLPERVRTVEGLWDQKLKAKLSLSMSVFHTGINDLISQVGDAGTALMFENQKGTSTNGIESEVRAQVGRSSLIDASYTFQESRDQNTRLLLSNSPRSLGKLNAKTRLPRISWTASANAQYVSRMLTIGGTSVSPYSLVNAEILSPTLRKHMSVSLNAYNLLDKQYSDPAPGFYQQQSIAQDGRSLRLKVMYSSR